MDQKTKIHSELRKNESYIREKFENCADILIRPMRLGSESKIDCLMVYIEVAVSNMMLDDSALGKMINHFWTVSPEQIRITPESSWELIPLEKGSKAGFLSITPTGTVRSLQLK